MDPLSVTASILAVIGAGSTIGRGLKKIISARHLPDILLQLNNEVTDLQYVVQDVNDLLRQQAQRTREDQDLLPSHASLGWALEHAKQTLLALESLIAYELITVDSRNGRTKIDWISWVRVESKVKSLKDDIRTDRVRLSSALSLLTSSISLGLHDQMRRICFTMESLKVQVAQTGEAFMDMGPQNGQTVMLRDSQQAVIPQLFQKGYNDPQASPTNTGVGTFPKSPRLGQSLSPRSDAVVRPYTVTFDLTRSFGEQGCSLACHKRGRIRSPYYLNAAFGSLLVGYSARPWVSRTCDDTDCRDRSTKITYTYTFPQWFTNRMVSLRMAYDQSRGPELCLRVVKVRPHHVGFFRACMRGTEEVAIRHIKVLLIDGESSVLDVDPDGQSALQLAIRLGRYALAAFLINAGSDIFHEDSQGLCPYILAWQRFLSSWSAATSKERSYFRTLFDDRSLLRLFKFPPLIRAYLISSRKAFDSVLSVTPRSAIDDVDATGSTALCWATRRCDYDSVKRLLLCGSDPDHVDLSGYSLLHLAMYSHNTACMQLLLAAKANVNSRTRRGGTAMHEAAMLREGTMFMELLLSYGASIESQDDAGMRPLHFAVSYDVPANVQFLLERDAKINAPSTSGSTALMLGRWFNAHETLRLSLRDKALDCDNKDSGGLSLLHYAAYFGDLETFHLLQSSHQMKKVNLNGNNFFDTLRFVQWRRDNKEVRSHLVIQSPDKDPLEWYSAFKALWDSIVEAQRPIIESEPERQEQVIEMEQTDDDDEDPEVWEDAQESLNGRPV